MNNLDGAFGWLSGSCVLLAITLELMRDFESSGNSRSYYRYGTLASLIVAIISCFLSFLFYTV